MSLRIWGVCGPAIDDHHDALVHDRGGLSGRDAYLREPAVDGDGEEVRGARSGGGGGCGGRGRSSARAAGP